MRQFYFHNHPKRTLKVARKWKDLANLTQLQKRILKLAILTPLPLDTYERLLSDRRYRIKGQTI